MELRDNKRILKCNLRKSFFRCIALEAAAYSVSQGDVYFQCRKFKDAAAAIAASQQQHPLLDDAALMSHLITS
jgi:cysteinyl-tRNA synthetase